MVENDSDRWTRHSHPLLKPLVVERSFRPLSIPTRHAKLNPRDTGPYIKVSKTKEKEQHGMYTMGYV